jgi:hypothetical protein
VFLTVNHIQKRLKEITVCQCLWYYYNKKQKHKRNGNHKRTVKFINPNSKSQALREKETNGVVK